MSRPFGPRPGLDPLVLLLLVGAAATLLLGSPYALRVLTLGGVYALAALGYQLLFGHAGALGLSQGTFLGLGAYAAAILEVRHGLPPALSVPAAVALPMVLAAVTGLAVLRLDTHYFALATLVAAHMALLVATVWEPVTGGANGIAGVGALSLFGQPLSRGAAALVWIATALVAWASTVAMRGRLGAAFAAMRNGRELAEALGIDTARLRLGAFTASAGLGGLAGWFYVHLTRVVSPDALGFPVMLTVLTATVIGGRRSPSGVALAALLVVGIPEWLGFLQEFYLLVDGVLLLIVVVLFPDGLARLVRRTGPQHAGTILPRPDLPAHEARAPVSATGRPLLKVAALSKHFGGVQALRDVRLDLRHGEVVGIIGPNGSGKTTLLNAISGLVPADRGQILFEGRDIRRAKPFRIARAGIARTFQAPRLIAELSVLANVALACRACARSEADIRAGIALAAVGIGDGHQCSASLAYPAQRRAELARALAAGPRLLLLDEPASSLPHADRSQLAALIRRVADRGTAVFVVEHDVRFLIGVADRLVCLDAGRTIADGPVARVLSDPAVVKAYLGGGPGQTRPDQG